LASVQASGTTPDELLVRRAQAGDVGAFEELVSSRLDRSYRLAWSIVGNDSDAADATQEAFLSAWHQLPRLRNPASFDAWLNRIVGNAARMSRRHRGRLREIPFPPAEPDGTTRRDPDPIVGSNASDEIHAVAEGEAIWRAFQHLRPEDRMLLVLHHVDERPIAEIARSVGVPEGTVKWRLHGARRALEQALEGEG
jgi:RNA polymerase sigma-70 factor (ECF subfamily)